LNPPAFSWWSFSVDDNAQIRTLMREITAQEPSLHVVGEAEDGADAFLLKKTLVTILLPTIRRLCDSLAQ
jgi:DNA-binding NarL/FixJ family response regulator